MEKQYGSEKKAKQVFYASKNKGTISGVDSGRWGGRASDKAGTRDMDYDGGLGSGPQEGKRNRFSESVFPSESCRSVI
jgi:hypothetical protein